MLKISVKAKVDGFMDDGRAFCYEGNTYSADMEDHEDGNYYYVYDETVDDETVDGLWPFGAASNFTMAQEMDQKYFGKYFVVIDED